MIEERKNEVAWNIIAEQTKFVSELIRKGTNLYLSGNIYEWFKIFTAIRENINYDLKPDEKTYLNDLEKKIWITSKYWRTYINNINYNNKSDNDTILKKTEYTDDVRAYVRKLMDILNRLGYFPKKEDRTKLSF